MTPSLDPRSVSGGGGPSPYIPGAWRCAKCGFGLVTSYLNARDGSVTAKDEPGERCPNDGAPLWRVTWQERVAEYDERLMRLLADPRVQAIECDLMGFDRPAHLKDVIA